MYLLAYGLLVLAFLCALGAAAWALMVLAQGRDPEETRALPPVPEWANTAQFSCLVVASLILLYALINEDFSVVYVYSYTDRVLPLFYKITAFWGGQAGSLLFWALCILFCGFCFQLTPTYKRLDIQTRLWFWVFYFAMCAFFALLLTTWTNPFSVFDAKPMDGRGLNPLLQHPGMIFHPPLLFLGYAGFTIPSCLALAQTISRGWSKGEENWVHAARPFILLAWLFLTAGIMLGAWWSYMELGWGGYWAWDPVENASIIPWLVSTAALHTMIIQSRRNKLHRTNAILMAMTTVSAIFATYLVRSGVVKSLHAFGDSGVGLPLLVFVVFSTLISILIPATEERQNAQELGELETREGFLAITAGVFLVLSGIILVATLWPVFSKAFGGMPVGLEASFYNTVCLPLFTLLAVMLFICPWLKWDGGLRDVRRVGISGGVFVACAGAFWSMGYHHVVACLAMAAAVAVLVSSAFMLLQKAVRTHKPTLAATGVHIGFALIVLGVAFSGPYKSEIQVVLTEGGTASLGGYDVRFDTLSDGEEPAYGYVRGELEISRNGSIVGTVYPERRYYFSWQNTFAEADTIPSLGNEFYASLLSVDDKGRTSFLLSTNPLVNWIWIGSVLMCLFPFVGLARRKKRVSASGPGSPNTNGTGDGSAQRAATGSDTGPDTDYES